MMDLAAVARQLRGRILRTSHQAEIPHLGSCLSCVDILTVLYFHQLRLDPHNPRDPLRDRFILSKGHAAPALFQILAMKGFYPESWLERYGEDGSLFGEHPPAPHALPGIEAATGSLGHGLPLSVGMALSARLSHFDFRTYVLLSDGECNEGSTWEAALFAAAQKLSSLCVIVDFNKWQATGRSCEVMPLSNLPAMWRSFGWDVTEVDGHDLIALQEALHRPSLQQPRALIAHTTKGKGVSFMEDDNNWHYAIPNTEQLTQALQELGVEQ